MKPNLLTMFLLGYVSLLASAGVSATPPLAPGTGNSAQDRALSTIADLKQAVEEGNLERVALLQRQLHSYRSDALPWMRQSLTNTNPIVRRSLAEVVFALDGNEATEVLLTLAVSDPDERVATAAAGMTEKRPISRALTQAERDTAIRRLKAGSVLTSWRWALLLAKVEDSTPSDAGLRVGALVERYVAAVMNVTTSTIPPMVGHSYLSSKAVVLNRYLLAFPHTDPSVSVPMLKAREAGTTDVQLKRWLLIARGFSRDESAGDELRGLVTDKQQDVSERGEALRAYSIALGTNSIPFLEQFVDNREAGAVPGMPPPEPNNFFSQVSQHPLSIVARDELSYQRNPEKRREYMGWDQTGPRN